MGPFLRTSYESIAKVGSVEAPLLVRHGARDESVPLQAGRSLFEAAREPKQFHVIQGAGHNDTYLVGGEEYFRVLRQFLDRLGR